MKKQKPDPTTPTANTEERKPYQSPEITTETIETFGAVCNGTTAGQRKDDTGAPFFCRSNRLNS